MSAFDGQHGGEHYSKLKIQPTEYIVKNELGWCEGNAIKYLTRHRHKGGAEDLKKAIHYAEMALELYYGEKYTR